MKQLTFFLAFLALPFIASAQEVKVQRVVEVSGVPKYQTVNSSALKDFPVAVGPQGPVGPTGPAGSGGSSNPFFDVIFPTSAAELNTAIAACTKPVLYVGGTSLNISQTIVVNNKSNLQIVGLNLELVLTSWNASEQGIMMDLKGTLSNILIHGFRFNCPLPSSSGDGGGYGILIARGAVCPSINRMVIQNCSFTCPNLHQNAISLISVGWGGFGTRTNVTVRNCSGENIKRMFFECTNQDDAYQTNGTARYSNIVVENCYAKNLGNGGVGSSGGMFVSFDGAGTNNEVRNNTVINPYFVAYEAVGTSNVRFLDNYADYEPGYTASFVGYSFTDGNHGASFGPDQIKVSGGYVRTTQRGFNLTYATNCTFTNVSFVSAKANTFVNTSGHRFRNCSFVGNNTNESLLDFQNSGNNWLSDCYAGNEVSSDGSGGRCTIVLRDGGCVNNRFLYLRHYQERNSSNGFYEATLLNFSGGSTNLVLANQSNNTSPGF